MQGNAPSAMANAQYGFGQEANGQANSFNGNQPAFSQNSSFPAQASANYGNQMPSAPGQMNGNAMQMSDANNTKNAFAPNRNGTGSISETTFGQQGIPLLPETNE